MEYTSTKTYSDYPCAHRQYKHKGNCALVHGYSRSFTFLFGAKERDQCGFVVDFGDLKWLKSHLDHLFDGDENLAEPVLHAGAFDTVLQGTGHAFFHARVGMHDVPTLAHHRFQPRIRS